MTRPYTPGRAKPRTQCDRLLDYLREAGSRGLTQAELDRPPSGAPIRRAASRVHELRQLGHRIETRGRRAGMVVYVLVREPQPSRSSSPPRTRPEPSDPMPDPGLFEPPPTGDAPPDRLPLDPWGRDER